jgi:anti-sigma factor RsiW
MTCADVTLFASAYLDDELDLAHAIALEQHSEHCEDCRARLAELRATIRRVRAEAPRFTAPASLAARVGARPRRGFWLTVAVAASVAVLAGVWMVLRAPADAGVADLLVAAHVRSQMAAHLTDVETSDQHVVKPWLSARLDFSPPVADLAGQGFPLVGGRLDYLDRHAAAALVYRRREHVINLFIWPESGSGWPESGSGWPESGSARPVASLHDSRGYQLAHWRSGGLTFWAVSDLNADELGQFASLVAAAARPRMP